MEPGWKRGGPAASPRLQASSPCLTMFQHSESRFLLCNAKLTPGGSRLIYYQLSKPSKMRVHFESLQKKPPRGTSCHSLNFPNKKQIGQPENLPRETHMTTQTEEVVPQRSMRVLLPEMGSGYWLDASHRLLSLRHCGI